MRPEVFVLGNRKGSNFTTQVLADQLVRDGVPAYPVTPGATPRWAQDRVRLIVNDGVGRMPEWYDNTRCHAKWLNVPWAVTTSANKVEMFNQLEVYNVPHLRYATERAAAEQWNRAVVVRHRTSGARGQGIEIVQPGNVLPDARLYTELFTGQYVKEYRVYVVDGKPVDIVQKMRRRPDNLRAMGIDPDDELKKIVRTWHNGWVFARNTWERRENEVNIVMALAEQAADACCLGYGGVDIAVRRWRDREPEAVVIETNTHLGLDGSTVRNLSNAIKEVYVDL